MHLLIYNEKLNYLLVFKSKESLFIFTQEYDNLQKTKSHPKNKNNTSNMKKNKSVLYKFLKSPLTETSFTPTLKMRSYKVVCGLVLKKKK